MKRSKEERMKRPSPLLCLFVLLAGVCLTACGSGGGNVPPGMMGGAITATFTPDNLTPGANSISMQAGTATGDTFQVIVRVTDIVDFFGAAFRITFDSASAEFLSFDDSTSFLNGSTAVVDVRATVDPTDAGTVLVVATLQNTFSYVQGITPAAMDDTLLILSFRATNPSGGNAFTFDTMMSREVTTCPPWNMMGQQPACPEISATVTWDEGTMTAN